MKGFIEEQRDRLNGSYTKAPIMIASTVSRASYGIWFKTTFDPREHKEEDKRWDDNEGVWKAFNQMRWYLTRVRAKPRVAEFWHPSWSLNDPE